MLSSLSLSTQQEHLTTGCPDLDLVLQLKAVVADDRFGRGGGSGPASLLHLDVGGACLGRLVPGERVQGRLGRFCHVCEMILCGWILSFRLCVNPVLRFWFRAG